MAKMKDAKGKGAKAKKKSWTKVKVKDKLNNAVYLDEKQFERMLKEIPKILCVTRAILCEKFKIGGSVARSLIKEMTKRSLLIPVGTQHSKFDLYKGAQAKSATEKLKDEADNEKGGKKKKAKED
jgi:small subunit ribosomal protein S25e